MVGETHKTLQQRDNMKLEGKEKEDFERGMEGYKVAIREMSESPEGVFDITEGPNYVKVVFNNHLHSFIAKVNGDILKAASWSAPAKHTRGSIFAEDHGKSCLDKYGPKYLR